MGDQRDARVFCLRECNGKRISAIGNRTCLALQKVICRRELEENRMKAFLVILGFLLILLRGLGIMPRVLLKFFLVFVSLLLTVVLAIACIEVFWVSPRDIAYRYVAPNAADPSNACQRQSQKPE